MKPAVGRIVHYHWAENDDEDARSAAAIIVAVNADSVNLTVFHDSGVDMEEHDAWIQRVVGVRWAQNGTDPSAVDGKQYWTWPPIT